jgi:hypothetical protein
MKRKCKIVLVESLHGEGIVFRSSTPPYNLIENFYKVIKKVKSLGKIVLIMTFILSMRVI